MAPGTSTHARAQLGGRVQAAAPAQAPFCALLLPWQRHSDDAPLSCGARQQESLDDRTQAGTPRRPAD
jgi:hypothetical protein